MWLAGEDFDWDDFFEGMNEDGTWMVPSDDD